MRVALVYNQKKKDSTQQTTSENLTEPPSSENTAILKHKNHPITQSRNVNDKFAEWDTPETIEAVKTALSVLHDVVLIEADENAYHKLQIEQPDIVFNIAEGLHGVSREAQIPAILELLQIPYTGSDPLTLAICLDKSRTKEILAYYHIPTPKFCVISRLSDINNVTIQFPLIVKPLHEGSSKGIYNSSIVNSIKELRNEISFVLENYKEPAIVEEFLDGREFTVAILGNGNNLKVLPIVEIKFNSLPEGVNHIYSYEAKWIWDRSDSPLEIFDCPALLTPKLKNEIETICCKAYKVLRCRDWCRIDVRLDKNGKPNILELNPLPGILPNPEDNSCFPKAARAAGMTYNELIQNVLKIAIERYSTNSNNFEQTIQPLRGKNEKKNLCINNL